MGVDFGAPRGGSGIGGVRASSWGVGHWRLQGDVGVSQGVRELLGHWGIVGGVMGVLGLARSVGTQEPEDSRLH